MIINVSEPTPDVGQQVTWSAFPQNGTPPYSYLWSVDVTGTAQNETETYGTTGVKTGRVTVTDDNGVVVTKEATIDVKDTRIPQ